MSMTQPKTRKEIDNVKNVQQSVRNRPLATLEQIKPEAIDTIARNDANTALELLDELAENVEKKLNELTTGLSHLGTHVSGLIARSTTSVAAAITTTNTTTINKEDTTSSTKEANRERESKTKRSKRTDNSSSSSSKRMLCRMKEIKSSLTATMTRSKTTM
uniref:Uncharacterized protein n=2 Tax=Lygus hesperus TaxID=30085 RepID=A0A146LLJ0_LYGHE